MSLKGILSVSQTEVPAVPCGEPFLMEAEREMAAFVAAAQELHGFEAGQFAAECWIDQLNELDWSNTVVATLRQVTIAAASRLAKRKVESPASHSRRRVSSRGGPEKKTVPSATGASGSVSFKDANRPFVLSRNPAPRNDALRTRPRGLQLIGKHTLESQESPAYTLNEQLLPPSNDYFEPQTTLVPECITDGISHDVRNHLCAVYANVELMSLSRASQTDCEELLEDIHSAIRTSIDILDAFLLTSATGSNHDFRLHSLNQVIAQAAKMVRIHPDARNVEVSIADHPILEICIDRTGLFRAVYNLLLNACQAASQGSVPRLVLIALREERSSVQIRVSDSGLGVPESIRNHFCKPSPGGEGVQSIGLGLSIARCAALEHGGFLELAESTMGNTVFVLHISKTQPGISDRLVNPLDCI